MTTLDFSVNNAEQETAIMPAALAKKLLLMYASTLSNASAAQIVGYHIDALRKVVGNSKRPLEEAAELSLAFYNERTLIANVEKGNWDAYKVVTGVIPEESVVPELEEVVAKIRPVDHVYKGGM